MGAKLGMQRTNEKGDTDWEVFCECRGRGEERPTGRKIMMVPRGRFWQVLRSGVGGVGRILTIPGDSTERGEFREAGGVWWDGALRTWIKRARVGEIGRSRTWGMGS